MSDDCVMLMFSSVWKCLLSTSRMARANPHMKKSEVMRMNGRAYCLLLNDGAFCFIICCLLMFSALRTPLGIGCVSLARRVRMPS